MKKTLGLAFFVALFLVLSVQAFAVNVTDTKFLTQPAISARRIAFIYAGDLWTADLEGKNVSRLTSNPGSELSPAFSPDGSLIAFTGQYDGNFDVYVVPAQGGVPKRLTWHPGADMVQGFTPDGKSVVFTTARDQAMRNYLSLYSVPVGGGIPVKLAVPYAFRAAYSDDGKFIAYNPFGDAFLQWKNYRGGQYSRVWIFATADQSVEKIPQPEGRSNDPGPMWVGSKVYFRSDRNGEFNLYSYDPASKEVKQLTFYKDFPVLNASAGAGLIIFEQAGTLKIFDPEKGQSRPLAIGIATDLPEVRERYARGHDWIRASSLSPSGARAVFEFRGEIVTVPAEKGDPRDITRTPGANERSPIWSPDGASIAYFSDESGEYQLCLRSQDGQGPVKTYPLNGSGYYGSPAWSPDSQKISYADNALNLYWIDLKTGAIKKIGAEYLYQPGGQAVIPTNWSPDSKWLAYTLTTPTFFRRVFVYSLDQDKSFPVTNGLSDVFEPAFDPTGKYLYFFASTDAGQSRQWFDMSAAELHESSNLYLAVLRKDLPDPLAKESDEEKGAAQKTEAPAKPAQAKPGVEPVRIDFDGLERRIVPVPVPTGVLGVLQPAEGKIFYMSAGLPVSIESAFTGGERPTGVIHVFDMTTRKDEVFVPNAEEFVLSADKKKMLVLTRDSALIISTAGKPEPGKGRLNVEAIEVPVVPEKEWRQIFNEAWRINRDYFYAPNMHGADWKAIKAKYEPFLPDVPSRTELNRLIQWMCSELAVGHHRVGGGDFLYRPSFVPGGLLGADYEVVNGRYRFAKVYGGLNWNPELHPPLAAPGSEVGAGEYLLAVNGRDLKATDDLYARFENTAGKLVEITVGPNPDGKGARTIKVVPLANEGNLRNRDWVEGNLKKVEAATKGRVAYVYVPNTTVTGYIYFKRYFFPQADKDAIIIDERFNGGGSVADYYIDWLRKPVVSYGNMRDGADLKTPSASIQGPKVMLINEMAGSGGDLLPWMWRKFGLGPLIGTRTWGGLVGTLGYPVLMDGGGVTAPNLAIWTEDGFIVENEGVPPDIEVEQTPKEMNAGHDPQLEAAIKVILEELAKNPPVKPKRPAFPVRVK